MQIIIPELCVVVLVGASGSGKTTFAHKHFRPTEVLTSDYFHALVSDDETDQSATEAAYECLFHIAAKRLDLGRLVVIDATNAQRRAREQALRLAKEQDCFAIAIVFDFPEELCHERNKGRPGCDFGPDVAQGHTRELKEGLQHLRKEGFREIYVLSSPEEADAMEIVREKLWCDKREESGPFDIIGDIHGCYDELCELLAELGYAVDAKNHTATPPEGRKAIFLGDLCDRGPKNMDVLRLVMSLASGGSALCVAGNHDAKLLKKLSGAGVRLTRGLARTTEELDGAPPAFTERVREFLGSLISHYVLDGGRLVVAHAGIKEKYQGRSSGRIRSFCLYGDTTGGKDEYGLPIRLPWAEDYQGRAKVLYGHTPSAEVEVINNAYRIDTGCVFGGKLTAYRYPEDTFVQVQAHAQYCVHARPLDAALAPEAPRGDALEREPVDSGMQE